MPFDTFNPTIPPSPKSSRVTVAYKVTSLQFGDNYSQRARDGVNSKFRKGTLSWDLLTEDEAADIIDFFDPLEGVTPFYWTPFAENSPLKWVVDEQGYDLSPINQTTFSLKITIKQVFDLDS